MSPIRHSLSAGVVSFSCFYALVGGTGSACATDNNHWGLREEFYATLLAEDDRGEPARENERDSNATDGGQAPRDAAPPPPGAGTLEQQLRRPSRDDPLIELRRRELTGTEAVTTRDSPATPEIGAALQQSTQIQTVSVRRRSPVSQEPRVRGYSFGQVLGHVDGAMMLPVRPDLDTILNKIDPMQLQGLTVTAGPYRVDRGPGFSFIEAITVPTPRYPNGWEVLPRLGSLYRANGAQLHNRNGASIARSDWGCVFNYSNLTGSDYRAGDGSRIPSSYRNQNFRGQVGLDLSPDSSLEFRFHRLEQTGTEYAAQLFDVRFLETDSFVLSYTAENPTIAWNRLSVDGWYNRTNLFGDTRNDSVVDRVERALDTPSDPPDPLVDFSGLTNGNLTSSGARAAITFGEEDILLFTVGADFRYVEQQLAEEFLVDRTVNDLTILTNLPTALYTNPGAFLQLVFPLFSYWETTFGMRFDAVSTSVDESEIRAGTSLCPDPSLPCRDLDRRDSLKSFFCSMKSRYPKIGPVALQSDVPNDRQPWWSDTPTASSWPSYRMGSVE